ncbi:MAG: hypothetical protein K9N34_06370 [Candidatus Marinimicrobia bacterium]|nr:hypothetical protein [Candidatus Neomarinimicrobiota bacterium]MCF7840868.1 hypothetical protein [Candidatus Neomarinimicrobiota bacterium]
MSFNLIPFKILRSLTGLVLMTAGVNLFAAGGGLSVLQYPMTVRSAGMAQLLDPVNTPTALYRLPDRQADVSAWQWISGVNGLAITVNRQPVAVTLNYFNIEGLEYRDEVPTEFPQYDFGYSNAALGITMGQLIGKVQTAANIQYLWERTLDYSAGGVDLNLAASMNFSEGLFLTGGVRHLGVMSALRDESSDLPTAFFAQLGYQADQLGLTGELSGGDFPVKLGGEYTFLTIIHLYGGVQMGRDVDAAGGDFYPSAGFEMDFQTFTLGYALYQINHVLGPRQYISLAWRF